MRAQEVHEPAIFGHLRNVSAGCMTAFERGDAIERLHEVGVNPGTIGGQGWEAEFPVAFVNGVIEAGRLGVVKENFEVAHAG
ncbi:MAG: hypothetical protein ACRD3P_09370 [Terriglobales bacterium]